MFKESVSLDIDGVTADTNRKMVSKIRTDLGLTKFQFDDITDWNLARVLMNWGVDEARAKGLMRLYTDPVFFADLEPFRVAQAAVLLIQGLGYAVDFRTSRPESCKEVTKTWVDSHYPSVGADRTHICGFTDKAMRVRESRALWHIDDHAETVAQINNDAGGLTEGWLLTMPWNQSVRIPNEESSRLKYGWFSVLARALRYRAGK